ncbi:hypothetical protein [Halobellus salinisoli]
MNIVRSRARVRAFVVGPSSEWSLTTDELIHRDDTEIDEPR